MRFNAGRAAKVALAQRGRSHRWLAEQLRVTPQRVSSIVGKEQSSQATLVQLADLFGLSLSAYVALGEFEQETE